jgi:isopenicillin N synthase-like dioxygenase
MIKTTRALLAAMLLSEAGIQAAFIPEAFKQQQAPPSKIFDPKVSLAQAAQLAELRSPLPVSEAKKIYPVIDISPWMHPSSSSHKEKDKVVCQVLEQATNAGSFNIVGHGISSDFLKKAEKSTRDFFNLPLFHKLTFSEKNKRGGYTSIQESIATSFEQGEIADKGKTILRETYTMICRPDAEEDNVEATHSFQQAQDEFLEKMQPADEALHQIFTAAVSIAKGVTIPLDHWHDSEQQTGSSGLLRMACYPALPPDLEEYHKRTTHSDWCSLTILHASSEGGLEEIRDGRWVGVPIRPGELHVQTGQLFSLWSNDLFKSNIHRVSNKAAVGSISMAYSANGAEDLCAGLLDPIICSRDESPKVTLSDERNGYFRKSF